MSAATETYRDDMEATYAVDFTRDREPIQKRARLPEYRRRGAAPSRVSGIHCRRNKRWTWGSGRGARLVNLRAMAIAAAVILSNAMAFGNPISLRDLQFEVAPVPGTPTAQPAPNGYGVVSNSFLMGLSEVTTAQYAQFLTATGAPNGTFRTGQRITSSNGTYTPDNGFGSHPVVNVNWFDAARFVNWLATGSTETGVYALNGQNVVVPRAPGAQVFLPSANEWTKAAYFNPSGSTWNLYAVAGTPVAGAPVGNASTANYANAAGGTTPVKAYSLATSSYGVYDMLGNVAEILETSGPWASSTGAIRTGGNWSASVVATSSNGLSFTNPAAVNANTGFRIAAVPEPSTYALLVAGMAGLGGFRWLKRRRHVVG